MSAKLFHLDETVKDNDGENFSPSLGRTPDDKTIHTCTHTNSHIHIDTVSPFQRYMKLR